MRKLVSAIVLACAGAAMGDVHKWVGGNHAGGGWNLAANWQNESGGNECPITGDVAEFSQYAETVVANDSDAALACSLSQIKLTSWSYALGYGQVLVFDFDEDHVASCAINGNGGLFRKRGAGALRLANVDTIYPGSYSDKANYGPVPGGIVVQEGELWFPQDSGLSFGMDSCGLVVSNGATFYLPNDVDMKIATLRGDGMVTVTNTSSARTLQIGMAGGEAGLCTFGGTFTGNFSVNAYAGLSLSGTRSDITKIQVLRAKPGDHMDNGFVAPVKVGKVGEASSLGTASDSFNLIWNGCFRYLGTGETTDKTLNISFRDYGSAPAGPVILDGGGKGGLVFDGGVSRGSYSVFRMAPLILCGSNETPCRISGKLELTLVNSGIVYTPYLLKRGPGVWRIDKHATRKFSGVCEVAEGTLQFETLAEAGALCSLGFATNLQENYVGAYDATKDVSYAYRLGKAAAETNAVFEFVGSVSSACSTRPAVLAGDAHLRASGQGEAALSFGGVSALADGAAVKVLTIDGENTGENVLKEVTDGAGRVGLVKDGAGTWYLEGNHSFTGDLTVKAGRLVVRKNPPYTWFRVTFADGYGSPYGAYVSEFALYDADGSLRNGALTFNLPEGHTWDDGTVYSWNWAALAPGALTFGENFGYYLYTNNPLSKLTDGTTTFATFSTSFSSHPAKVVMRLTNGTEVVSFDFCQFAGNYLSAGYQTASAITLEGSVDGAAWTTLVTTNGLPIGNSQQWYFSSTQAKVADTAGVARKASEGEGLAFTAPGHRVDNVSMLEEVGAVSVAAGAVLETSGDVSPVLDRIVVDAASGSGTIKGFTFAANVTVDVRGLPKGGEQTAIPLDWSGVDGFGGASFNFLENGETSSARCFRITPTSLRVFARGTTVFFR